MRIVGCFKVVPDLDRIPDEEWQKVSGVAVDTDYVPTAISCFDESALELMLRCADEAPESQRPELAALTFGDSRSDPYLKSLFALGFCEGIRIDAKDRAAGPDETAANLAAVCEDIAPDVIVTGYQSADGNHGYIPAALAEALRWPCLTEASAFSLLENGTIRVRCQTDLGFEVREVAPPCVIAVGNVPGAFLRVPTIKAKMAVRQKHITIREPLPFEAEEGMRLINLSVPDNAREGVVIEGDTAEEKVEKFLSLFGKAWGLL